MAVGFSTRDVARIIGLSPRRIRSYARSGLLQHREPDAGTLRYSFSDLVVLRTTKRLIEAGVPSRRIRRALRAVGHHLHDAAALSRFGLATEDGELVVSSGGVRWEPETGQLLLRFEAPPQDSSELTLLLRRTRRTKREQHLSADEWYDLGVSIEASSLTGAVEAYESALRLDPDLVEAHINLGRLLHMTSKLGPAQEHYRRAMELDPLDAIPVFNLAVVLEDLGESDEALKMYRRAVRRDPLLADAHYNLALMYQRLGRYWEALRHLRTYKRLTDDAG